MANANRKNLRPVVPKLFRVVGPPPTDEITPLREIRKLGYEYFWFKPFRACSWLMASDAEDGKTFL
jgi:hypothetical protein